MIDGLKTYPAMRDSGVPWLGEVPEHWQVQRIKTLFREKDERSRDGSGLLLSLTRAWGLLPQSEASNRLASAADLSKYKVCRPDELVMNRMQAWSGMFAVSAYSGLVSPDYSVFVATEPLELRFFEQVFKTPIVVDQFAQASKGIGSGFNRLYTPDFGAIPVAFPPLPEQAAIVRFLDHADRRIRRYIRAKQKRIKLLEEQKQAIIHRAVTRGLDPNVRLKPSGVEWLGDVPEHWEVRRCRYIFREVDKRSSDGSEQHLSMSQRLGLVPSDLVENRTLVSESYAGGKVCEVGDLVLNRLKAHLGVFALARHAGVTSPDYTILRPIEASGIEYFEQVLRSPACRRELWIRAKGIVEGFWRLYTDDFYDIRLPVPPAAERNEIVDLFVTETTTVDRAMLQAEREITLLREYRTRLIADVVTGKLDVREAAARLPEGGEESKPLDEAEVEGDADEADARDTDDIPEESEA